MAKLNPQLAESIHRNLTDHIRKNYLRYYYLAYSFVKNQDTAVNVVTNAIYFSLFNGRRLTTLPPMQVWFLQLVVKDGMRTMTQCDFSKREFTKDSKIYAYMETLEPSATNAFKLYYFERLPIDKVCQILHFNEEEVLRRLSYVRGELKIDSSLDGESAEKLKELIGIYESVPLPADLTQHVEAAIKREEDNFAKLLAKQEKDKVRKPLGVLIFAALLFFATIFMGKTNPMFAESVLSVPIINHIFVPFF